MCFQAEPLSFKRDRPTAAKRVQDGGQAVVTGAAHLGLGNLEDPLVCRVLPLHKLLDDAEEPLTLGLLRVFGRELIRMGGRIVNN